MIVSVLLAVVSLAAAALLRRRRRRRPHHSDHHDAIAVLVDLYAAAARSGATVPLATTAIAPYVPGEVGAAWRRAAERVRSGEGTADALLGAADELGDEVRPLVDALVHDLRYGAPLGEALARIADQLRVERRFALEARVRRAPVVMMLPLTMCVLPAFVLLAIVPLVLGALSRLGGP